MALRADLALTCWISSDTRCAALSESSIVFSFVEARCLKARDSWSDRFTMMHQLL